MHTLCFAALVVLIQTVVGSFQQQAGYQQRQQYGYETKSQGYYKKPGELNNYLFTFNWFYGYVNQY
jgi:hypothetical protein